MFGPKYPVACNPPTRQSAVPTVANNLTKGLICSSRVQFRECSFESSGLIETKPTYFPRRARRQSQSARCGHCKNRATIFRSHIPTGQRIRRGQSCAIPRCAYVRVELLIRLSRIEDRQIDRVLALLQNIELVFRETARHDGRQCCPAPVARVGCDRNAIPN